MMTNPRSPLQVFLYHTNDGLPALRALRARLGRDGVDVVAVDDFDQKQSRESAIRNAIQESDMTLIGLSKESLQIDQLQEIGLVSGLVAGKKQGDLFVMPVRFDACDLPDGLRRWQAVDLFEENGYERLMLALKLRADGLGVPLEPQADWRIPLQWDDEDDDIPQDETPDLKVTSLTIAVVVLALILLVLGLGPKIFRAVVETEVPVEVMLQNSTQSALEQTLKRSMTQTALAQFIRAPLTQTAIAQATLQNPATPTLQFPTIIALPTEIVVPGNVTMIYVSGDNFIMGSDTDTSGVKLAHMVYVNPFYMDKYEVTNALYKLCVEAGGCKPPVVTSSQTHPQYYRNIDFSNHPMINVNWDMARQYCEWRGARLPTEAEWEKAARFIDGRQYPWGGSSGCQFANYTDAGVACVGDTVAIGGYEDGRSFYGVFDMSGNVSEWVNSLYWTYPYVSTDGRENTTTSGLRVVRGGSWASPLEEVTTYHRLGVDPTTYNQETGFRCARNAKL